MIMLENYQITHCLITSSDISSVEKEWTCTFKLKEQNTYYKMYVFLKSEGNELHLKWDYLTIKARYENKWKICMFYTPIGDYIFEQIVEIIKKYSKERIRLLSYHDKNFIHGPLDPLFQCKLPKTLKLKEST